MRHLLIAILFVLAGCGSCGEETTADNNTNGTPNNVRTEQDAGSGPCQGCFDDDDVCQDGKSEQLCGAGGTSCTTCEGDTVCNDDGECVEPPNCTPDSCDGCCTADDVCVAGDMPSACGTGGARCSECPAGGACNGGSCTFGCSADNCNGCCDGEGNCIAGDDDAACGVGGAECSDCASTGDVCAGGGCVASGCAQSCAGCCDGATCVDPATDEACGADGSACSTCHPDESCIAGTCAAPDGSRYDLILVSANIPSSKLSGAGWDTFGGLSDVIAYASATDPTTGDTWFQGSSIQDETLTPEWNEILLEDITAAALAAEVTFEFFDFDAAFDDEICIMDVEVHASQLNGQVVETTCDYDSEMKWRWRVEPTN